MTPPHRLEIIPLGGLGEFGMNVMVYRWGDDCLVVDMGIMFPRAEHLGVDVIIPDLSFLEECGRIHGVVLTHAHEDHVGALPYLLARHDVPVYATDYTLSLVRGRLAEHDQLDPDQLVTLPPDGERLSLGPFSVETIAAAHSIPLSKMLVIETPLGTVLHTADFKLDPHPPHGPGTDLSRLARLGQQGVLALMCDSTNADRPGFTPGERAAAAGIDRVLAQARRRVLVTTFASNVHRVEQIAALARRHGRRLAIVGSSLENHVQVARRHGQLHAPPDLFVSAERAMELPPSDSMLVVTGSQGEPLSALARIALGRHRDVTLDEGDCVIHSARVIPGNESSVGRLIDHLLRRGATVVRSDNGWPVHVSGHPAQDELRLMLQLLQPRYLVPIHGDYRQLHAHARLAVDSGMDASRVLLAESGDVITLDERGIERADRVHVGQVFIDASLDEVDRTLIRDRRRSAADGIVVPVIAVDRESGAASGYPVIVTRGFVPDHGEDEHGVMEEAKKRVVESLAEASSEERADESMLKARIHAELRRFLRRRTQRQPLIIPVVVEL